MSMNNSEVYQLLCIVEKALGHPKLRPIVDLAAKQLDELAAVAQVKLNEVAAAEAQEAKEEAEKQAKEQEKQAKDAELSKKLSESQPKAIPTTTHPTETAERR